MKCQIYFLIGALLVLTYSAFADSKPVDFPDYAVQGNIEPSSFLIFKGFPISITDIDRFNRESSKAKIVSSFGEYFYVHPIAISENDIKLIRTILKTTTYSNLDGPLPQESYPQADYKICSTLSGWSYNIHLYTKFHALYAFDNRTMPHLLKLPHKSFYKLVAILEKYN